MTMSIDEDAEKIMARNYYSGKASPKEMEKVELLLAQYGITEEQIRAKAIHISGPGLSMFSRMENNCETSLRSLRKERDRRPEVDNRKTRTPRQSDTEEIE